jgi:hypothetical protein
MIDAIKKTPLVDSMGWPLPKPNFRIKPNVLSERIRTMFKQLESRGISGDSEAMKEFEHLLSLYGDKHQRLLRERAKDGDKLFDGSYSIQELLWLADDTIECLAWLAIHRSKDCEYWAERRLNWPGFISVLASINRQSKAVIDHIPLGKRLPYNRKKTEADSFFRVARFVIDYVSKPSDSFSGVYFAPFIRGVLWMKRPERDQALMKFAAKQGPITQTNWVKWKPVFERVITLYYGPSWEKWKMIPDSPIPSNMFKKCGKSRWKLKTYRDICPADIFGLWKEFGEHLSRNNKFTPAEMAEIGTWSNRKQNRPCIMDVEPDEALNRVKGRAAKRKGGWGDYKNEILNRCKRLLPKS